MSPVGEFTRYIGLVVLLSALVLLAPTLTVTAWSGVVRGCRDRWHRMRSWRRGTQAAEDRRISVEVRVGERRGTAPDEVLEHHGITGAAHAARELWAMLRDGVEAGALALAVVGGGLRLTSAVVQQLPEPLVLGSDLLLVLGTFLLMQKVIREYPVGLLATYVRPSTARMSARPEPDLKGRSRHLLEMLVLAPGFVALIAWPAEIGRFLAQKQFTGPQDQVIVVWACELPWFLALTWFLARPLLPRRAPAKHARATAAAVIAPVTVLRPSPVLREERQAA